VDGMYVTETDYIHTATARLEAVKMKSPLRSESGSKYEVFYLNHVLAQHSSRSCDFFMGAVLVMALTKLVLWVDGLTSNSVVSNTLRAEVRFLFFLTKANTMYMLP
jgi:hypothetical protein